MSKETETISLTITAEQLSLIQGALLATGGTDQRALSEVLTAQAKGRILSFTEARREVIRPEIQTDAETRRRLLNVCARMNGASNCKAVKLPTD